MNNEELVLILEEGEGLTAEFKQSFDPKSLANDLIALANGRGGRIFLGINDQSEITGVEVTNTLRSQIQDLARNCEPKINIALEAIALQGKKIMVITVPEGENKPYSCSSGFYWRQGANSRKLSRDEILEFAAEEGRIKFDSQINENFIFPRDFDATKVSEFLKLVKVKTRLTPREIVVSLGLAVRKKERLLFRNAGVLFFAKNPGMLILTSRVVCVNYRSNEKVTILDTKTFDGGIINNIQETVNYIKKHINAEYKITKLKREEVLQYPEEAIREAVVNALMHRDYADNSGDIVIEVFKNKLVVSNPGGLVKGLRPEDFGKTSRTRNPLIADVLLRTEYVEKLGTGIQRIKAALAGARLPPPSFEFNSSFFVTFYDRSFPPTGRLADGLADGLADTQEKIIKLVAQNKTISKSQMARVIGISTTAIDKNIARLKEKGILERIGSGKRGYWKLKLNKA